MKIWTTEKENILKKLYPKTLSSEIAKKLNVSVRAVYNKALCLGLKKDKTFIAKTARKNALLNGNLKKTQFKKGAVPHNKGKKQTEYLSPEAIEKSKVTRFKKGNTPHNAKYDGHERVTKDGYIFIRIKKRKYILKHHKIWQEHYGEIPKGHIIIFKDGNPLNCTIENLEAITRDENVIRNANCKGYSREIQKADYARVKLQRKIKEYGTKQN